MVILLLIWVRRVRGIKSKAAIQPVMYRRIMPVYNNKLKISYISPLCRAERAFNLGNIIICRKELQINCAKTKKICKIVLTIAGRLVKIFKYAILGG